jgi:hypothetical protein
MYREVMAADQYAHSAHADSKVTAYNDAVLDYNKEKISKKKEFKKTQLLSAYPDSHVTIEGVKYVVPNPYRARYIRQNYTSGAPATFFNPNPTTKDFPYAAKVRSQNAALINTLSFDEIMMDKDMTIAFLEALWFCGRNPTLEGERCTPAKVIAELRQFEKVKMEDLKYKVNKEVTKEHHWAQLKMWMDKVIGLLGDETFPKYARVVSPSSVSARPPSLPVSPSSGGGKPLPGLLDATSGGGKPLPGLLDPSAGLPGGGKPLLGLLDPSAGLPGDSETEEAKAARLAREAKKAAEEAAEEAARKAKKGPPIPLNIPIINPGFRPGAPLRPTPGLGFRLPLVGLLAKV